MKLYFFTYCTSVIERCCFNSFSSSFMFFISSSRILSILHSSAFFALLNFGWTSTRPGRTPRSRAAACVVDAITAVDTEKRERTHSEEEKKKIINTVWERRQKDIEDAMKSVRGDAEIMAERMHDLREELAIIAEQASNTTFIELLRRNLNDIQWLILVSKTHTHHS